MYRYVSECKSKSFLKTAVNNLLLPDQPLLLGSRCSFLTLFGAIPYGSFAVEDIAKLEVILNTSPYRLLHITTATTTDAATTATAATTTATAATTTAAATTNTTGTTTTATSRLAL